MLENLANCATQNERAKSKIVAQVARIVRRAGLDYEGWRYVAKQVRKECDLRPAKKGRRLPRILTAADFRIGALDEVTARWRPAEAGGPMTIELELRASA